jgi:hypothetical protein
MIKKLCLLKSVHPHSKWDVIKVNLLAHLNYGKILNVIYGLSQSIWTKKKENSEIKVNTEKS